VFRKGNIPVCALVTCALELLRN